MKQPSITKAGLRCATTAAAVAVSVGLFPAAESAASPEAPGIAAKLTGKTVFLDPGHQGPNHTEDLNRPVDDGRGGTKACQTTGMTTMNGVPEHTVNWNVAQLVKQSLEALGAKVVLSRPDDTGWGGCVDERAAAANRSGADIAISIHADSAPAEDHGFHLIVPQLPVPDSVADQVQSGAGLAASRAMRDAYVQAGFEPANYAGVVDGLQTRGDIAGPALTRVPDVFVEMGNGGNADDAKLLESPEGQLKHAVVITTGLAGYLLGMTGGAPARTEGAGQSGNADATHPDATRPGGVAPAMNRAPGENPGAAPGSNTPEGGAAPEGATNSDARPGTAPEAVGPQNAAPEASAPEAVAPQGGMPETAGTRNAAPEASAPEAVAPQGGMPETAGMRNAAPEASTPEAVAPQGGAPAGVAPEPAAPQAVSPQEVPAAQGSGAVAPEAAAPGAVAPAGANAAPEPAAPAPLGPPVRMPVSTPGSMTREAEAPLAPSSPGAYGIQQGSPAAQPGAPEMSPGTAGIQPGTPGAQPDPAGVAPGASGAQPGTSGVQPGTPGIQPGTPGFQPGTPGAQPGTPGAQPGTAGAQPGTVGAQPGTAGIQPGTPGASSGLQGYPPGTFGMPQYPGSPGYQGAPGSQSAPNGPSTGNRTLPGQSGPAGAFPQTGPGNGGMADSLVGTVVQLLLPLAKNLGMDNSMVSSELINLAYTLVATLLAPNK
ncbi:N-acetylmuramoyl-L-alanine amidase [Nocardia aurantia]|uniref:MurNAc-LAA domain-containing protein n=1 Tax=Nocardia aurantia TaxID=2585199 RepID=A0A7K0DVT9_9NOCA|nr:hypothetical protein [Nocardia aurantia]